MDVESSKESCFVYEKHECAECREPIAASQIAIAYFEKELCQITQKKVWKHKKWLCMKCGNVKTKPL
jgi:hypothetical protein